MPTQANFYPIRCNDKDAACLFTLSSKIIRCFSSDIVVSLQKNPTKINKTQYTTGKTNSVK